MPTDEPPMPRPPPEVHDPPAVVLLRIRHLYHTLQQIPDQGTGSSATRRSPEYNRLVTAIHAASLEYRRLTEGAPL